MPDLTFELAPRPGMTASQRKAELDSARFVAVRTMAHMHYKDANGNPLMTYQQTLEDRERVKQVILQFEIANGLIADDLGTQVAAQPTTQPPAVQQAPQMSMTPAYAVPPQPSAPAAAPAPAPAPAAPVPQAQPEAPATRTRTRRGAGGGAPQMAAPAPQMMPQVTPMLAPQAPVGAPVLPSMTMPLPPPPAPMAAPQFAPPMGIPQQAPAATVDLSAVLTKLDDLGRGLTIISKAVDELNKKVDGLDDEVSGELSSVLCALHHIYGCQASLFPLLQQEKVASLADFQRFISKYAGPK